MTNGSNRQYIRLKPLVTLQANPQANREAKE